MITMEMFGKIRRMYLRDKLSLHEITKRTGLSRNTIRRWLRGSVGAAVPTYRRKAEPGKLAAFHEVLEQALKADAHRAKQNRRTAKDMFAQIKAEGYEGGYSQLTAFIRDWRGRASKTPHAFVPLKFELGEAFQFDWSEEGLVIGGIYRRLQVSHLKLCASRSFWLVAYPSQGHEMLFDAHTRSFTALGGIPRRGIYDNMKTAVDRVNKGKGRVVNARFAVMCAHYLFDADFCNVASGWEKGVVEKNVQDSRRRIWLDAQSQRFSSFAELNAWLGERCRSLWGELRHPEYKEFSLAEMLEQERAHMMPMPTPFDGYVEKLSRVSGTCLINVHRNHYSVPCELAGQWVSARLYPDRVVVVAGDAAVASHERLTERGHILYDWQHYIPLVQRKPGALRNGAPFADIPAPLQQLRQGLMRHAGGDRIMAQVLAAVPTAGLDAVLVAVKLVIESGALSAEHVLNVIARLNASPPPASVETSLQLKEAPQANTGRYDGLRDTDEVVADVEEVDHA
ncbi:MAG: integrase [Pseudomonadales bacterium RIFCSPHIGHO2_02_FULL_60_43]|nr:MAG: integrase [Pseudomonadales bacterium RIFCSPHIGHO2_02_FULL_60_43]